MGEAGELEKLLAKYRLAGLDLISDPDQRLYDVFGLKRGTFSRSNLELPQEEVTQRLLQAAAPWLGSEVAQWQLHRWRYSQPGAACAEPFLYTAEPRPLAFAGDGFGGPRIEGAFLSGMAAAHRIARG